jgi:hypothetical protein
MRSFVLIAWFLVGGLWAQTNTNTTGSTNRGGLWNCKLPDGNYYSVSLGAIDSVSRHEYLLDGAFRVVEVTVATRGSTQARFYVMEKPSTDTGAPMGASLPDGIGRTMEEMSARAPGAVKNITNSVVKKFPDTSHAKIIEYRLPDREILGKLFEHLLRRWQNRSPDDTFEVSL